MTIGLRRTLPRLIFGVVAVALLALVYAAFIDPYLSRLVQIRFFELVSPAPEDIRHAAYLLASKDGGGIYSEGKLDYSLYRERGVIVADFARSGEHVAALAIHPETKNMEVFLDGALLVSSETQKQGIAISPDGTRVVYAERVDAEDDSWVVMIADASGTHSLGSGFRALFANNYSVFRFTEKGITALDLITGEEAGTVPMILVSSRLFLAQSPDSSLIAMRDTNTAFATVYRVRGLSPFSLEVVHAFAPVFGTLAVTERALYVTKTFDSAGSALWAYPFSGGEPERVHAFPSGIGVAKLVP